MKLNWNFKMWGAVFAVAIILLASGIVLSKDSQDQESVSIISRVNNEGSGIFVRADTGKTFVTVDGEGNVTYHPEDWKGTVFMTPGASSIQHMILMDIVKEKMGLKFVQNRVPLDPDAVHWAQVAPGDMAGMLESNSRITGGIAWEPHFAIAMASGNCKMVMDTSQYLDGHPCCVISGNNTYLDSNRETVVRFMAAYIKSVQYMTDTFYGPDSEERTELINMVIDVGTPFEPKMTAATASAAFENIQYVYELGNLNEQLADVIETFESLGVVKRDARTEAGYAEPIDFANHLIRNEFIDGAFSDAENTVLKTPKELGVVGTGSVRIRVAYLAADIHQMPLHVGIEKGFFKEYGVEAELFGPFTAGGPLITALLSGEANIGFAGSPPVVSTSINNLR
jgi:ABC-type nitrate/sulfonate/bicarbonate transport system substrate-binding protein